MSERAKNIFTILAVVGFIILYQYWTSHADLLRTRAKYTIGYVRGSHWAVKSGRQINYFTIVSGATYKGGDDELPGMKVNGGRYLVKYDSLDPGTKAVYYDHPIPDSIKEAPANGWTNPPFPIPADITSRKTD